jgi:hypothetical protein
MSERADAAPPRCLCQCPEALHATDVNGVEYCRGCRACEGYLPAESPPAGLSRLTRDAVLSARRRMR